MVIISPCVNAARGMVRFRKRLIKMRKKILRTTFQKREIVVGCPECQTHSTSMTQKTLGGIRSIPISMARHVTPDARCWSCSFGFCTVYFRFLFSSRLSAVRNRQVSGYLNMFLIEIAHLYTRVVPKAERLRSYRRECRQPFVRNALAVRCVSVPTKYARIQMPRLRYL